MASQTQASQSDVDDQRFAELLKPIKDLTQNWEVSRLLVDSYFGYVRAPCRAVRLKQF